MLDAHLDPPVRRILLHDAQAVLDADTIRRVENRYGAVVLRGALRRAIRAGVIQPLPLKTLALMQLRHSREQPAKVSETRSAAAEQHDDHQAASQRAC